MTTIAAWRDFYIMGGGALATLTGLLFVAMSIHLGDILAVRRLTRNIEVALYGILFQIGFCGFVLMPQVTLFEVGVLIVAAGAIFALASLRFGSYRSRVDTWTNVSFGLVATPIGALMMVGWAPAMYLYALIFGLSVASLVRLCWRLLTMAMAGLQDRQAAAMAAGNGSAAFRLDNRDVRASADATGPISATIVAVRALIAAGEVEVEARERSELIRRYRDGHRAVVDALAGLKEDELDRSAGGEWTPRMIAHHLADSEMMSALRLRRLLTEESPVIHGYDEEQFARKLTGDRPIEPSLEAMRWARESTAQLLDRLTEEDWRRVGTHSESGPYSVEDWLTIYARHGHDHAKQIERSRGRS